VEWPLAQRNAGLPPSVPQYGAVARVEINSAMKRYLALAWIAASLATLPSPSARATEASSAPPEPTHTQITSHESSAPIGLTETEPDPKESPKTTEARRLYIEGSRQAEAGDWNLALAAYRRAFELHPAPSTLFNMGYCESQLGHLVEAWLLVSRALAPSEPGVAPGLSPERRAAALAELERLRKRVPILQLSGVGEIELSIEGGTIVPVEGEATTFHLDTGAETSWRTLPPESRVLLNPGRYHIQQRQGGKVSGNDYAFAEATTVNLVLARTQVPATPPPAPPASPSTSDVGPTSAPPSQASHSPKVSSNAPHRPYRTLGLSALVMGGLSFLVTAVGIGLVVDAESTLGENCSPEGVCPPELEDKVSQFNTAAQLTNVSLITGLAATGVGVSLLALDGALGRPQVAVSASLTGVVLRVHY
jgi:hypothetical protein